MYRCQAIWPLGFYRAMQATVRLSIHGYPQRMWSAGEPFEKTEPEKPGSQLHLRLGDAEAPGVA